MKCYLWESQHCVSWWSETGRYQNTSEHDDIIKRKHFLHHWPLWGNSSITGEFPSQGQWCGALMFSLISAWTNGWVNNWGAGDLRCNHTQWRPCNCSSRYTIHLYPHIIIYARNIHEPNCLWITPSWLFIVLNICIHEFSKSNIWIMISNSSIIQGLHK